MSYTIEFLSAVQKQLKKISDRKTLVRLIEKIEDLASNPRPEGARKIASPVENLYRIRVGSYRIIYQIEDDLLVILVVRVGDRKEIYRNLERMILR